MTGVTPIGIITNQPDESRRFYKETMGLERVQTLREIVGENVHGVLMRLESPQIELLSTEIRILDRDVNQSVGKDNRIIIKPRNFSGFATRLSKAGICPQSQTKGGYTFEDLNGISWFVQGGSIFPQAFV